MTTVLFPLYGSQEESLEKCIRDGDRKTWLLFERSGTGTGTGTSPNTGEPVGILIYKIVPTKEHAEKYTRRGRRRLDQSLEIKTLFLVNSAERSGKGYGSVLLQKALQAGRLMGATTVHVTVSERVPSAKMFFEKNDFSIVEEMGDKYLEGVTEYLLARDLN
jgi:GNAT superfamily N-acetyltransferase